MRLIAPDYYPEFTCIAERCKHTCCANWEIDIDAQTLALYRSIKGTFGKRLRAGIIEDEDGARFKLDSQERCPFLNAQGLCDIISHLGAQALCQVCDDHPRFRAFFTDRIEIGLGLCCEAAASLILRRQQPVRLVVLEGDKETQTETEARFFAFRDGLMHIVQDRSRPLTQRIQTLKAQCGFSALSWTPRQIAEMLDPLERLDPLWEKELLTLSGEARLCDAEAFHSPIWDTALEQLLAYLLYRHLSNGVKEENLLQRVAFALFSMQTVYDLCVFRPAPRMEDMIELARMYSSEIEYSDENMMAILNMMP